MAAWVVKCRLNKKDGSLGWHWRGYFDDHNEPADTRFEFGGPRWIRSNWSKKYIKTKVRAGDLVVCYQTDRQSLHGFCRMASDGRENPLGSDDFNTFFLTPPADSFRLDRPLPIQQVRKTGCHPNCFEHGKQGTIFPVSRDEVVGIALAAVRNAPELRTTARRWFRLAGYDFDV